MDSKEIPAFSALAPMFTDKAILLSEPHARSLFARVFQAASQPAATSAAEQAVGIASSTDEDGIAVIPVVGVLTKFPTGYDGYFGLCPAYSVMQLLGAAVDDTAVSSIVLDIDSPGGFVNGSVELADAVALANEAKPVTAIVRGLCCSGAYWIASQCSQIIARPESEIGNIGVYSVLADFTKAYEKFGIDLTLVATGQFKGLGADGKVTEDLVRDTKRIITGLYQQFVNAVARGRSLDPETAQSLADGKAYLGAQAKQLGLIDAVSSNFESAVTISSGTVSQKKEWTMTNAAKTSKTPKAEDKQAEDTSKALTTELNAAITSANSHKDQCRKTLDAYTAHAEDMDDDMQDLAGQAVTALRAASEEATRCADTLEDGIDGDEDDPDEDDGDEQDKKSKSARQAFAFNAKDPKDYIAAFGDIGARWFCEGKPFAAATAEYIADLKKSHKAQVDALTAERDDLKIKLAAIDRGNEPASFDVAEGTAGPTQTNRTNGMTENLAKYANSIRLPRDAETCAK